MTSHRPLSLPAATRSSRLERGSRDRGACRVDPALGGGQPGCARPRRRALREEVVVAVPLHFQLMQRQPKEKGGKLDKVEMRRPLYECS